MKPARAGLEVHGIEGIRPYIAVPAHHIEWVAVELELLKALSDAHNQPVLAGLVAGRALRGRPEVALRVGSVLEDLAVAGAVPRRGLDLAGGMEHQPKLLRAPVELPGDGGAARDQYVVTLAELDSPEDGTQNTAAAVHVDDLV